MSRPVRIAIAVALPGAALLYTLCRPQVVVQGIILPAATVLWIILRTFVLSIDQVIYWWGLIALVTFGSIALLVHRGSSRDVTRSFGARTVWDPAHRWKESITFNRFSAPPRDSFRRDLAWLLSSLYASPRPGGEKYQVREALQEQRIPIPPGIHDFLFASTMPRAPAPSFFSNPRAHIRAAVESFVENLRSQSRSRRRAAEYVRSAEEVLAFMETQLEMKHELNSNV